jgi:hypothetical protein
MKQLLISVILFCAAQTYAQSSLEIGTQWTYTQVMVGGAVFPINLTITGDSIINGNIWYKLEGQGTCAFSSDRQPLIRETDGTWLVHDTENQNESILYDFNLTEGESYIVTTFGPNVPIEVKIDSVRTITINGISKKVQYASNPNSNIDGFLFASEVIEGVGSVQYLFPQGNNCAPHAGPIRCFESSTEFIDFDVNMECDEVFFILNTLESKSIDIDIYPNPATDRIYIRFPENENYNYTISSISGVQILHGKSDNKRQIDIDLNSVESGLYLMQVYLKKSDKSYVTKFAISR